MANTHFYCWKKLNSFGNAMVEFANGHVIRTASHIKANRFIDRFLKLKIKHQTIFIIMVSKSYSIVIYKYIPIICFCQQEISTMNLDTLSVCAFVCFIV